MSSAKLYEHYFSKIGNNKKLYLTQKKLDAYFIPKKNIEITVEHLEKTMRGVGYIKR